MASAFSAPRATATACMLALSLAAGSAWAQSSTGASGGASGAGIAPSGSAQTSNSAQGQGQGTQGDTALATADRNFIMRAAASGLFEVEAARLAADRAQDESVKRYAAMLVEHHSAANQELMALAQSKGLSPPARLPGGKRRELDKLQRTDDARFDAEFVRQIGVKEHRQDVRLFSEASRNAKDPELKAWAAKMLPTLEKHLSQAQSLQPATRPGSGGPGGAGGATSTPKGS